MGGKRHKGVGYNRARKTKVSPLVTVPNEPEIEDDDEDEEECSPPAAEHSVQPAPESLPIPELDSQLLAAVDIFHCRMSEAKKALLKVKRRWKRRLPYILDHEKYNLWRYESVVQREQLRLAEIDYELCQAKSKWLTCCKRWSRRRSYYLLRIRHRENPKDIVLEAFYLRALDRVREPVPVSPLIDMWPGHGHNFFEHTAEHFGLAIAYGVEWSEAL